MLMYVPHVFKETDQDVIFDFLKENSFVTIVSTHDASPVATHIPISVQKENETVVLHGHFAKANPQWKTIEEGETLVIFQGPHAYVSPKHYIKVESVPTWNYVAAHVYGKVTLLKDPKTVELGLSELIKQYEPSYQEQWDGLSERYKSGMLAGIVGFRMEATKIEAAAKLSQNKEIEEQKRIVNDLVQNPVTEISGTGKAMQERNAKLKE